MSNQLHFKTDALFKDVNYDSNSGSWGFVFDDKIGITVSGFWRLLEKNKIVLVSLDHGQQFGLPKPVDLSKEIKNRLTDKKLITIEIDENTADLTLMLTGEFKLEAYIASTGYETYDFTLNNKHYIGLGSGEIAIMDI